MYDNKLEVGQPAMIINTRLPENRWLIGSVVVVEAFIEPGQDIKRFFNIPEDVQMSLTKASSVMVSGSKKTGKTLNGEYNMLEGYSLFNAKNLMPIPKLKESEIQKEKELEFS